MAKTVFETEVAPFDDGEGGTAFGKNSVVEDLGFQNAVVRGFTVLHHCGFSADDLDIVTPMRTFAELEPAKEWIAGGCK